jgi:UDP-N-acetylglucosamine diphosphorylase/glucosamine-1-phosphate N-acetyltransferase
MRLVLFDGPAARRQGWFPLTMSRSVMDLCFGARTVGETLAATVGLDEVEYLVDSHSAAAFAETSARPVNRFAALRGEDLLLVHTSIKPEAWNLPLEGGPEVGIGADGAVRYARIPAELSGTIEADRTCSLLKWCRQTLPNVQAELPTYSGLWDLMLANPQRIADDFVALGRHGVEGTLEEPVALRGRESDIYVAPGALVQPMVVLDATGGPIYIDQGAEIHPFTRIEGPAYIGPHSVLLGAKFRAGTSVGPHCRIGGEVEQSIVQGYSNKYHDGFLGHSYVGEWVNLGALTATSDLRNDYGSVSVTLDGTTQIDTGSGKVGSLIGDHSKLSIGVLLNTGTVVGAMTMLVAGGRLLPKYLPAFGTWAHDRISERFSREQFYAIAERSMQRRGRVFTDAQRAMWDRIHEQTTESRRAAVTRYGD